MARHRDRERTSVLRLGERLLRARATHDARFGSGRTLLQALAEADGRVGH